MCIPAVKKKTLCDYPLESRNDHLSNYTESIVCIGIVHISLQKMLLSIYF